MDHYSLGNTGLKKTKQPGVELCDIRKYVVTTILLTGAYFGLRIYFLNKCRSKDKFQFHLETCRKKSKEWNFYFRVLLRPGSLFNEGTHSPSLQRKLE